MCCCVDHIDIGCLGLVDCQNIEVVATEHCAAHRLALKLGHGCLAIAGTEVVLACQTYCRVVDFVGIVGINHCRRLIALRFEIEERIGGLIGLYCNRSLILVEERLVALGCNVECIFARCEVLKYKHSIVVVIYGVSGHHFFAFVERYLSAVDRQPLVD